MLRKIKILAELKKRNETLKALREKKAGFDTRESDLEKALNEAESEQDINTVQQEIDDLGKEIAEADVDKKIDAEQAEVDKLNAELETITEPKPADPAPADPKPKDERGAIMNFNKRGIFYTLDMQQRSAVLADEEVKTFLTRAREMKGQTRGVNNVDVTIPQVFLDIIRPNLPTLSKLYSLVNVKKVKGTARKNVAGTYPEGVWTEMCASLNELEISFNQVEVDGFKVGGFLVIDNAILEDSDEALASEILTALSAAIAKALDRAILFGTGKRMPTGIATRLAQTSQPSDWGAKAPTWTDLHTTHVLKWDGSEQTGATFFAALYGKLTAARSDYATGNLTWIMNKKTHQAIISKAIALDSSAAVVSTVNGTMPVIGGNIIELELVADNDIIGGYFELYALAEREGGVFASSDIPKFFDDQTAYKGTARYDGKPVFGEAFVIVNIANTNPTTTSTFPGDSANVKLVSLSALTIGSTPVTLFPPFDANVLNYHCKVTAHANKITATALTTGATVSIKNGSTAVTSGSNATFTAGENILTVEVTNGNATKRTYTVVVDDATA
ncbi:MAG: phage major capsid protein [Oscillospiraceae bacterium]|nr:phage major capsid protein [Oscillospiraceae bacterium]